MRTYTMKLLLVGLVIFSPVMGPMAYAVDTTSGYIYLSGDVPAYFNLQVRGVPGDLDLSPGVVVTERRIAILHFKVNEDISEIAITSLGGDSATKGQFTDAGGTVIDTSPLEPLLNVDAACTIIDRGGGIDATDLKTDLANVENTALVNALADGIEEDCDLLMSYTVDRPSKLPLAGRYSMSITITMTN